MSEYLFGCDVIGDISVKQQAQIDADNARKAAAEKLLASIQEKMRRPSKTLKPGGITPQFLDAIHPQASTSEPMPKPSPKWPWVVGIGGAVAVLATIGIVILRRRSA